MNTDVTVFVAAGGNAFMTDIAGWIVEAANQTGRTAKLVSDRLPAGDGGVELVVAPHELFGLSSASDDEIARAMVCSIPICTEQPGTPWFNLTADLVADAPLVVDINRHGVDALARRGHTALHLRLGGVPSMRAPTVERDRDVLFLGGTTPRRAAELARLAPILWGRAAELRLFRFSKPVHGAVPGVVFGRDKYELLARSRVLLNIHRDDAKPGYFEWARMVEAMANGCAVLTEPSAGFEPLAQGEHFVATDHLAATLLELFDDRDRCSELGERGRAAVLDEFPLSASLAPVLERIEAEPPPTGRRPRRSGPPPRAHRPPLFAELRPAADMRRRVYRALLAEQALQRQVGRSRCLLRHGIDDVVTRRTTPAYDGAVPDVTVVVTLYNYATLVTDTLDSIAASTGVSFDVVLIDDCSTDDSRATVEGYMAAHPELPMLLLGSEINRGLSESRNLAIAEARADRIMVMDADNLVYPTCIERLSAALDGDRSAAFAYCTLEAFGAEPGLRSEMAWFAPWLCEANYIDAQAMIRRSTFQRHGGYRDASETAYGWEDWALWLRLAAAGEHGVHVPQMLGRYRTQVTSMVSITNLAADDIRTSLVAAYPDLPWPERTHESPTPTADAQLAQQLSAMRQRQEHRQRPSTLVTEALPGVGARLTARVKRLVRSVVGD